MSNDFMTIFLLRFETSGVMVSVISTISNSSQINIRSD